VIQHQSRSAPLWKLLPVMDAGHNSCPWTPGIGIDRGHGGRRGGADDRPLSVTISICIILCLMAVTEAFGRSRVARDERFQHSTELCNEIVTLKAVISATPAALVTSVNPQFRRIRGRVCQRSSSPQQTSRAGPLAALVLVSR